MQGVCHIAAGVEHDLGRAEDVQPPVQIHPAAGAEGLHHGLLAGLGVVNTVDDNIALCQHSINVAVAARIVGTEVALVVGAHGSKAFPVILRVHKDRIILCGVEIQHSSNTS